MRSLDTINHMTGRGGISGCEIRSAKPIERLL